MPLSPDPSGLFQIIGFVGINFAMYDEPSRVLCRVSWEALQDRAALDRTDQNDVSGTFDR